MVDRYCHRYHYLVETSKGLIVVIITMVIVAVVIIAEELKL